jgi:sigma-E factor negative regulatory protein RseB
MRSALALFFLLSFSAFTYADVGQPQDAMAWLQKIAAASHRISYTGTFVYDDAHRVETSRIWHFVDSDGEHERLETLDGPAREIVRTNDDITCYLPEKKAVLIEKRTLGRFPDLLPAQLSSITQSYIPIKAERDRVAGFNCQVIILKPKDTLRYERYFCADLTTGLPLRVRTYDNEHQMVEAFAFTELSIGGNINRKMLQPQFALASRNWHIDRAESDPTTVDNGGWSIGQPPGFKQLASIKRSLPGHPAMSQIVYSDGIAAISVFIEPLSDTPPPSGAVAHGAINIYFKPQADKMITVIGEAPPHTIKWIADSVTAEEK